MLNVLHQTSKEKISEKEYIYIYMRVYIYIYTHIYMNHCIPETNTSL